MKLVYSSLKDEDVLILTDFSCEPSQELLNKKGLYKILWSKKKTQVQIDDYALDLQANDVLFCTPLNEVQIPMEADRLLAVVFNKQFFCIQTHDDQVSCQGFLSSDLLSLRP